MLKLVDYNKLRVILTKIRTEPAHTKDLSGCLSGPCDSSDLLSRPRPKIYMAANTNLVINQ